MHVCLTLDILFSSELCIPKFFMSLDIMTCIANGKFYCMTGCLLGHVWIYPRLHFTTSALSISPTTCPYSNFILSSIFVIAHKIQRVLATCHACVTTLWNIGCILLFMPAILKSSRNTKEKTDEYKQFFDTLSFPWFSH